MGRITLGKRTPSRGKRYGATSRIRRYHVEITRMDWPRAVPHTGVSEVDPARLGWDSYTAEKAEGSAREDTGSPRGGAVPWKNTHVGSPRGITTHGHLAQHRVDLGQRTSTGPGVWCSATPDCRGCGRNFNRVRRGELNWEATRRTYPVRRGEWRSKRDWHRAGSSVTGHPRQVHGRTLALYGDCKTSQTY